MKTQFFSRNLCIGVLMTFVLVLGMSGVADALTLSKTSGDLQTKPAGSSFEIIFSVKLDSNNIKRYNSLGQQIDEYGNTIDSSGYLIEYIGTHARRLISATGLTDANSVSAAVTYTVAAVTGATTLKVIGPNERTNVSSYGVQLTTAPADPLYVTGGNKSTVVDSQNRTVYIEMAHDSDGTFKYTTAKENPVAPYTTNAPQRYAYNDEQIKITSNNVVGIEMIHGGRVYTLADAIETAGEILDERDKNRGIPSSITLRVKTGSSGGTHTVTVEDTRSTDRANDYPTPKPDSAPITFTLYTTNEPAPGDSITATDRFISTTRSTLRIDDDYTLPDNKLISYQVLSGPGTLYVGTSDNPTRPAAKNLIAASGTADTADTSVNTPVFLYLNRGESRVRAYVDGGHPEDGATITYDYTGTDKVDNGGDNGDNGDNGDLLTRGSLNISVTPSTGTTRTVTVTALNAAGTAQSGISVLLNVTNGASLSRTSGGTPLTSTLTLPGTAGNFVLTATTTADFTADTETITVTLPGNLSLALVGSQVNGSQTIQVTARDAVGTLETTAVLVTLSGAGISRTVSVTGTQNVPIVLPSTSAVLTASATGYNSGSIPLPARTTTPTTTTPTTTTPTTTTPTTPTGPAGAASSIEIDGNRQISGTVNRALRLRARVLDANDNSVSGVRVTFKVLAPGKGRLSQRGNGRAVQDVTDRNGYATASLTPLGGNLIVEAKAAGVTAAVTFIIDIGSAPEPETPTPAPGTEDTPRTAATIDPVVHIGAANRPPMLWVDGGKIYALVGAEVQEFGSGVAGAMNVAIGGDKVYWTEQTGESSGTINSANLDGTDVTELKSITAVPMGIAVDTEGSKLYWTNSRGRIQSLNVDGSGRVENVRQNLPSPMDIAVARGNLYWTQYNATAGAGNVGIASPTGRGTPKYISTGADMPGSLAIHNGKVYWTEMTGTSAGTINAATLSGTDVKQLASIRAVPSGIAVDGSRSKLYWTNSRGRIQSADLTGKKIQNVVDGLGMPGDMVISNSITAPAATTPPTPPTASNKYDINGDGTVDSTDVDALLLAVLAELTNAKYDVNGDGAVDVKDVQAVNKNLDAGAAGAPTLLGRKFSALEVEALQAQIDLLIATGDRSPAAMKTLIYLQQLLVMARPEKTQLLANYPNPFNPETWIPYELAMDTTVKITIYNAQGSVVRVLELGHQSAGYYTGRDRAAYWDGRNALGEPVASGIYFYQLETDEISSLRKMVILK